MRRPGPKPPPAFSRSPDAPAADGLRPPAVAVEHGGGFGHGVVGPGRASSTGRGRGPRRRVRQTTGRTRERAEVTAPPGGRHGVARRAASEWNRTTGARVYRRGAGGPWSTGTQPPRRPRVP